MLRGSAVLLSFFGFGLVDEVLSGFTFFPRQNKPHFNNLCGSLCIG